MSATEILLFRIDSSYQAQGYGTESKDEEWNNLQTRESGVDVVSLATSVISAFLQKLGPNNGFTDVTIFKEPSHANEINNKYATCLRADIDNPQRGRENFAKFEETLHMTHLLIQSRFLADLARAEIAAPEVHFCCTYVAAFFKLYEIIGTPFQICDFSRTLHLLLRIPA